MSLDVLGRTRATLMNSTSVMIGTPVFVPIMRSTPLLCAVLAWARYVKSSLAPPNPPCGVKREREATHDRID